MYVVKQPLFQVFMLLEGNLGSLAIDLTVSQQMNPEFL